MADVAGVEYPRRQPAARPLLAFQLKVRSSHTRSAARNRASKIKLQKPVVTAFDVDSRCGLLADTILYQGKPMLHVMADQSFPYSEVVWFRQNLLHFLTWLEIREGSYLLCQRGVGWHSTGTQLHTSPLAGWCPLQLLCPLISSTEAELHQLYQVWVQVKRGP